MTLTPAPGLVYRTTGGELDIYFFLGPDPEQVVSQYTEAVGRYYVPPYWALGFHLCRWGYNRCKVLLIFDSGHVDPLYSPLISLTNMEAAWQRTRDAGIPFDAQWGDIDIMDRALDFTVNPNEFSGLSEFAHNLHEVEHSALFMLSSSDWDALCDHFGPLYLDGRAKGRIPSI